MNGLMILVGLIFVGGGSYALLNAKKETEWGFRLRGMNTAKLNVADHPRAVQRNKRIGGVVLSLGVVMIVWGIFDWSDGALAIVLLVGGILGMLGVKVLTL